MPASSATYWTRIRPDRRLRCIVIASGLALLLAGVVLIAILPLPPLARGAAIVLWGARAGRELRVCCAAYRRWGGYRIDSAGEIGLFEGPGDGAREQPGRLLPGCIVLPGLAWLRFSAASGPAWGELVARETGESEAWRRFQVIFRHRHTC